MPFVIQGNVTSKKTNSVTIQSRDMTMVIKKRQISSPDYLSISASGACNITIKDGEEKNITVEMCLNDIITASAFNRLAFKAGKGIGILPPGRCDCFCIP
jgi:hypothetical protein